MTEKITRKRIPKKVPVKVMAVYNRMRNPHTGILFIPEIPVDINDLDAPENYWVRSQIKANVLKIV